MGIQDRYPTLGDLVKFGIIILDFSSMRNLIIFIWLVLGFVSCAVFLPYDTVEGLEIKVEPLNNLVSSSKSECILVVKYKNIGKKPVKIHKTFFYSIFENGNSSIYDVLVEIQKDTCFKGVNHWLPRGKLSGANYLFKVLSSNQLVIDTLKIDFGRILDVNSKDSLAWLRKNEDYGTYRFKFTYTPHKNYFKKSSKQVESNWAEVVYKK